MGPLDVNVSNHHCTQSAATYRYSSLQYMYHILDMISRLIPVPVRLRRKIEEPSLQAHRGDTNIKQINRIFPALCLDYTYMGNIYKDMLLAAGKRVVDNACMSGSRQLDLHATL